MGPFIGPRICSPCRLGGTNFQFSLTKTIEYDSVTILSLYDAMPNNFRTRFRNVHGAMLTVCAIAIYC